MGDYVPTITVPRLTNAAREAVAARRGRVGVGRPILQQVLELESYDDTLENVALERDSGIGALFRDNAALREDYTLRYMLDLESRGSLLNLTKFRKPWHYTIKVRKNGVVKDSPVDLVETFNWLLGLRVEHHDNYGQVGLLFVTGTDPNGLRTIVVWRDADLWPNDKLEAKCRQAFESFRPKEFDVVYVNGDNHLPVIKVAEDRWKVNLIEETFHQLMFDTSDVE
jgi:adenine-specific DNA-methyltransferase